MSLIAPGNVWALGAVIAGCSALSIYLERRYKWAARLSALVIALLLGILLSNLRVIPTESTAYDAVWNYLIPLALPLLLFQADLRKIIRESGRMLAAFLFGACGTMVGAFAAYHVFRHVIPEIRGITAMMAGTYIGGSVNFMALSSIFDVSPGMVSSATIADNFNMALYFIVLLLIPVKNRMMKKGRGAELRRMSAGRAGDAGVDRAVAGQKLGANPEKTIGAGQTAAADRATGTSVEKATETRQDPDLAAKKTDAAGQGDRSGCPEYGGGRFSILNAAVSVTAAFAVAAVSGWIADFFAGIIPDSGAGFSMLRTFFGNEFLWITTVSVIAATAFPKFFGRLHGGQAVGTYLIYCFMFVIGAPASISGILRNSPLLLLFAMVIVIFNMLFTFGAGKLMHMDNDLLIIASNANIGGPATAASMAVARGWDDLAGPALLIGSFGYVIGNYAGLLAGYICA